MRTKSILNRLTKVLAVAAVVAGSVGLALDARADKLHLKDGRVVEGEIVREGDGFVFIKVKIGTLEKEQLFTTEQIARIERGDAPAEPKPQPKPEPKPEPKSEPKPEPASAPAKPEPAVSAAPGAGAGSATRVAILNFGPPSSWQGVIDNTVGIQISAQAWKDVIPLLEKDRVQVVIVRINSGGGLALEVPKFNDIYEKEYKPRFRTVGWVESAISAAAMAPYVLEEFYFMPEGNLGACTAFSGSLNAAQGLSLETFLYWMEQASDHGKRDRKIMRAMQIQDPLSANIDPQTGEVTFFQDTTGEHIINPKGQVLTLRADQAMKFGFAKGVAGSREELATAMGLQEVEWVGEKASEFIDDNMRESDKTSKRLQVTMEKFAMAMQAAGGAQDRQRRGAEASRARTLLAEIRRMVGVNPNFELLYGLDKEWFQEREQEITDMMRPR